jgi:SAM-dependent methyltransferase/glycosyltransferase involved in cell wall biosynthesis
MESTILSSDESLAFPKPTERLPFTGERYTSDVSGPIRHQHHHRYLFAARFCADRDVLDVACGEGYGSALLGAVARRVRGVDLDPETVTFAERNYATPNVSFRQGDAARLEEREAFDVVISFETIEHLVEHDAFIDGVCRALRPGGLLIISSPDKTIYTDADEYKNEFHQHELDRAEFKDLIGRRFANVTVFNQDSIVGSLIGPEGGMPASLELFSSEDGRTYRRFMGTPRAHYLIALASDAPLPLAPASALDDTSWVRQAQGHEIHAVALGREVQVRDGEIGRLNEELTRNAQERARLDEKLSLTKVAVSDLRREVEQQQALIDERARQLVRQAQGHEIHATGPVRRVGLATARLRRRLRAALTAVPASARIIRAPKERTCVLFVDWMVPTPDQDSGSMDLWYQLGLFRTLGYDIAFMPVVKPPSDSRYMDALRRAGIRLIVGEANVSAEQLLQEKASDFDLIFLNRIHVAGRLLAHVRRCAPDARIVFNTIDLHFLREEREAALNGSQEKAQAAAQRRQDELCCITASDATIVLSEAEGRLLSALAPSAAIHVIPFVRVASDVVAPFDERTGVLFVGGFLHAPNIDAVNWFVTDIWPKVRRALPTATLEIVGSNVSSEIRNLDSPQRGILVRGFVQDLDPVLSRVRLTVAPLRFGAGIKGKVATSLAAGVPCVATPIASEGMEVADGESILVGQSAEEFAAAIVRVHEDAAIWASLSKGGQTVIREHYSSERIGQLFLDIARSVGVAVPDGAEKKLQSLKTRELEF